MLEEQAPSPEQLGAELLELGSTIQDLIGRIDAHIEEQHQAAVILQDAGEMDRLVDADPMRWLEQAQHTLRLGLMLARRAVEQPASF